MKKTIYCIVHHMTYSDIYKSQYSCKLKVESCITLHWRVTPKAVICFYCRRQRTTSYSFLLSDIREIQAWPHDYIKTFPQEMWPVSSGNPNESTTSWELLVTFETWSSFIPKGVIVSQYESCRNASPTFPRMRVLESDLFPVKLMNGSWHNRDGNFWCTAEASRLWHTYAMERGAQPWKCQNNINRGPRNECTLIHDW